MKKISATIIALLLLTGCATVPVKQGNPVSAKAAKSTKWAEPCPCSPTPNQTVKSRWFPKFKIKWLH